MKPLRVETEIKRKKSILLQVRIDQKIADSLTEIYKNECEYGKFTDFVRSMLLSVIAQHEAKKQRSSRMEKLRSVQRKKEGKV